ncbi:IS30 family transposase [Streptomyces sp. NBC_01433]|uniref:IS30 family transposase n=1 Tax=Streptomyces sp. NBC_01433 TaxID=2903864 RepID=UPI002256F168|nr:IS30 family transposase [Streptomyces sp. NBC_01433]MCX4681075.1 IS30 family transposase [Streptomyces sp. NBC_01433]
MCAPVGQPAGPIAFDRLPRDRPQRRTGPLPCASADEAAYAPGRRPKRAELAQRPALRALVEAKLALCWPPEQIAGWLRRQFPGDTSMRISHEAIYLSLYGPRRRQAIDRSLTRSLLAIPPQLRRTLTWDRGREIAEHQAITTETGMPVYLCKPRSPWQRGTNENTNRLLRQYLPKGADLRTFSQADLDTVAHELSHRPRKTHGYHFPAEVYADLLNSGDALTA